MLSLCASNSPAAGAIPYGTSINNNGVTLACNGSTKDQIGASRPPVSGEDCSSGAAEQHDTRAMAEMAQRVERPDGFPRASAVCFSSRWRHPANANDPHDTFQAAADFHIDLSQSYMVGDDLIDIETGKNAGCKTVLVLTGKGCQSREQLSARGIQPDIISANLLTAIKEICR